MTKKSIFDFNQYRPYLRFYLSQLPQKRGALKAWASHLGVHSTLVSQVMIGKRDFTEEQAFGLSHFLSHNPLEREYFLELLRLERAGTPALRKHHMNRLRQIEAQALQPAERVPQDRRLTEKESAVFYSSWVYSAIRLTCSIDDGMTVDEIAEKLSLPRKSIVQALSFLREHGFVEQNGIRFVIGTQYTHLGKESPFWIRHHNNWRLRALQRADQLTDAELMYTAPFSVSEKDFRVLRAQMMTVIDEFLATVKASEGEMVACFNLDLFRVTGVET